MFAIGFLNSRCILWGSSSIIASVFGCWCRRLWYRSFNFEIVSATVSMRSFSCSCLFVMNQGAPVILRSTRSVEFLYCWLPLSPKAGHHIPIWGGKQGTGQSLDVWTTSQGQHIHSKAAYWPTLLKGASISTERKLNRLSNLSKPEYRRGVYWGHTCTTSSQQIFPRQKAPWWQHLSIIRPC